MLGEKLSYSMRGEGGGGDDLPVLCLVATLGIWGRIEDVH